MHANYIPAFWASVLFLLILEELVHAFSFKFMQVFNHAHAIAFTVTFIQMIKVLAWYGVALTAGLDLMFRQLGAASFDVAVFGSWKAACAMRNFASLPRNSMRVS